MEELLNKANKILNTQYITKDIKSIEVPCWTMYSGLKDSGVYKTIDNKYMIFNTMDYFSPKGPESDISIFDNDEAKQKYINIDDPYAPYGIMKIYYHNFKKELGIFEYLEGHTLCVTEHNKSVDIGDFKNFFECEIYDISQVIRVIDSVYRSLKLIMESTGGYFPLDLSGNNIMVTRIGHVKVLDIQSFTKHDKVELKKSDVIKCIFYSQVPEQQKREQIIWGDDWEYYKGFREDLKTIIRIAEEEF